MRRIAVPALVPQHQHLKPGDRQRRFNHHQPLSSAHQPLRQHRHQLAITQRLQHKQKMWHGKDNPPRQPEIRQRAIGRGAESSAIRRDNHLLQLAELRQA